MRLDRGYEEIGKSRPEATLLSPIKRWGGCRITALGRAYNRMLNGQRIVVEHVLSRLQKFKALAGMYRGPWTAHEQVFCVVSGLVNYKATGQFQLTGS